MVNMTLAIPNDLHKQMRAHPEIKWSEVARKALREQAHKLAIMDELTKNSKLTEQDAKEIGDMVKQGIRKRHGL